MGTFCWPFSNYDGLKDSLGEHFSFCLSTYSCQRRIPRGVALSQQILSMAIVMIWAIFLISWMSFIYYRKDKRVPRGVSKMLLIAGILGGASTLPYIFTILLSWDAFVEQFTPVGGFVLPLLAMVCLSGILSGISGIGYLLSLKKFREKRHERL